MENFSSGKRLQTARNIKRVRLKDLADAFNVGYPAIQKWQDRGIPDSAIEAVADYFKVKKWVFCDETLSEENYHCAELAVGAFYMALANCRELQRNSWKKPYQRK